MEPHSADQAGGESVFTSDGLPSLVAPLPPPPLPSIGGRRGGIAALGATIAAVGDDNGNDITTDHDGDAVIEEESDPRMAFEAFSEAGGWTGLSADNAAAASSSAGKVSAWEDPRRRLFQLKSEIDQLEATLANEKQHGDGDDVDNLQAMTLELKSRIGAMGMADSSSLATMLRGRQEDLSSVIVRDLERFGQDNNTTLSNDMENLTLKGESKEGSDDNIRGDNGKIVYELYRQSALSKSSACTIPREAMLEERLRKLELAMGTTNTNTTNGTDKSIMERIQEAERLTKEVDAKQIEKLAAKAKVVRADLEAAARAKAKLSSKSSSSNNNAQQKEDAQMISSLHSQLIELEGVSAHLPALTVRLLELSNLHTNAAEFASRLDAAEAAVGRSEGMLSSVEEAMHNMEGGWKENMDMVERNVERLDELSSKSSST
eukprot:CAMPEP_0172300964 /NCGR_PEP_ID=MMETSP1058-20130122/2961_1 /TAXON_ID=83371 /ORGANISM="Detonula confervacea, Strain CCMP 353" /LENGTH=432 /DNA_ID=CAMNT_0013010935 /DNA_START=76 /DNA_END=1374 /DNA_ORIENTATION=+